MFYTRKSSRSRDPVYRGHRRFEHWYRDNQVYFLTARCADGRRAFASEVAQAVFWDRFAFYTDKAQFTPWVTSLVGNHYHTLGYNRSAANLGPMMQKLHGSVAKLVNDLPPRRAVPFWRKRGCEDYFDGCIRDETQCRRAYRYVLTQSMRHGLCDDWRAYPNTRVNVDLDAGVGRALQLGAFLEGVPYRRYQTRSQH